ncbi:MAG: formylglycine-generating enzyme family protein [Treponemataceae bacterium]
MREYTILVFITKEKLTAFDLRAKKAVSLKGNTEMKYTTESDIAIFNEFIKNNYNIDECSEVDMNMSIINCGAKNNYIDALFNFAKTASEVNIINARHIVPIIYACAEKVQENTVKTYSLFGATYKIAVDEHKCISCHFLPEEMNTEAEIITPKQFEILFTIDGKILVNDNTSLPLDNAETEKLCQKIKEQEELLQAKADELEQLRSTSKNSVTETSELSNISPQQQASETTSEGEAEDSLDSLLSTLNSSKEAEAAAERLANVDFIINEYITLYEEYAKESIVNFKEMSQFFLEKEKESYHTANERLFIKFSSLKKLMPVAQADVEALDKAATILINDYNKDVADFVQFIYDNEEKIVTNEVSIENNEFLKSKTEKDSSFAFMATLSINELARSIKLANEKGFILVEGGTFEMGNDNGANDEKPVHNVTLDSFYINKYPVTQAEWADIMKDNTYNSEKANLPATGKRWADAISYCNKRSIAEWLTPVYTIKGSTVTINKEATGYRLPTEAEWEYAARNGSKTTNNYKYSGSNCLDDVAWYINNMSTSLLDVHPVGTKKSNLLGLYDMSGNSEEWCYDVYDNYSKESQNNPIGPAENATDKNHVYRGGAYNSSAKECSVTRRGHDSYSSYSAGFRLVLNK